MDADRILIIDFGGAYTLPVANKLRGESVYCEILPCSTDAAAFVRPGVKGVVLVGGVEDAYLPDSKAIPDAVLRLNVPVLGIGYGARALARELGAVKTDSVEDKHTARITFEKSPLFEEMVLIERYFERIDLFDYPEGTGSIALTDSEQSVAFACPERSLYGIQFYPERNDPDGIQILNNFALRVCGCEPWWNMETYIDLKVNELRERVGEGEALLAVSGGIDSTVAALLMNRAIGKRLRCLHIDTGLLRKGEAQLIKDIFTGMFGLDVVYVDASERVLNALKGVSSARRKHEIITGEIVSAFMEAAAQLDSANCLVESTIYTDILPGGEEDIVASRTHEQLCARLNVREVVEPVKYLFKYEVRKVGELLGLPPELVNKQQFPVTGLALRCMSEVTAHKLSILRESDAIFSEEIARADLEKRIPHSFALLADFCAQNAACESTERMHAVALRALTHSGDGGAVSYRLPYELLERVVSRITSEVVGVNRVLYDLTGNPPAPIEWE